MEGLTLPTLRTIELSPATRADHLARLRAADADHPLDVLVVGGGSAGVGAAYAAGLAVGFWASTAELAAETRTAPDATPAGRTP
ncbi:hypothetical protein [Micrococcus porci]|uniref:hypothetical protein n=1 Tax=Micrococcus porci TaxID=2856555 RepID=UPI003CF4FEE9